MAPSAAAIGMHMPRCRVRDARALLSPGPGCPRAADGSGCPRSSGPRIPERRRAMDPTLPHLHQCYHRPPLPHGQAPQLAAAACIPQRPSASTVRLAPPTCLVPFLLLDVKGRRSPTPMSPEHDLPPLRRCNTAVLSML